MGNRLRAEVLASCARHARAREVRVPSTDPKASPSVRSSPELTALCTRRAPGGPTKSQVGVNGQIIEQAQILTTHNLASLFDALPLREHLRPHLRAAADRCFRFAVRRVGLKHFRLAASELRRRSGRLPERRAPAARRSQARGPRGVRAVHARARARGRRRRVESARVQHERCAPAARLVAVARPTNPSLALTAPPRARCARSPMGRRSRGTRARRAACAPPRSRRARYP